MATKSNFFEKIHVEVAEGFENHSRMFDNRRQKSVV